jgi:ADP-heptose:LPS heptosyltransferase
MNKKWLKILDRALRVIVRLFPPNKPMRASPKNILIIKLSAMGDAFCLIPAIIRMRESLPGCQVDWLTTRRTNSWIFREVGAINSIIELPTEPKKLIFFLLSFFFGKPKYDLVIDYDQYYAISEIMAYKGKSSSGFVTPLKGRTFSLGYPYDPIKNEKIQFLDMTSMLFPSIGTKVPGDFYEIRGLARNRSEPELFRNFVNNLESFDCPLVVIYPGSSINATMRRWPPDRYLSLAKILSKKCIVIVAGGPDELAISGVFVANNQRIVNFIAKLEIEDWLWLFRHNVDLIIGNDGGMMHLAESQGVPSISLFGPALGSKWGSLNKNSIILDVDLNCRPCIRTHLGEIPQICARGDLACMNGISVDFVVNAAEKVLKLEFFQR